MATNQVTVSAVPFNQQTQTFQSVSPAPVNTPKIQPGVPTAAQNLAAFNQSMVNSANTYKAPTSSNVPVTNIGTQPVNIPTQAPTQVQPTSNYALSGIQNIPTPVADQATSISEMMLKLIPQTVGQSQEFNSQLTAQDYNKKLQAQQDTSNLILQKQAELNQNDISLAQGLQNIEDQAIPMQFITGQQLSVQNRANLARGLKVSEINMLNAQSLAQQGNLALARQTAQDAVNIKYGPVIEMYNTLQSQLQAIQPLLTNEEKNVAAQQTAITDIQKQILTNKQTQEKNFMDMLMKAPTDLGATPDQIRKAIDVYNQTGDPIQAFSGLSGADQYIQSYQIQNGIRNSNSSGIGQLTIDNGYTFDDYKKGIAYVESSGGNNYGIEGPMVTSGLYKGEKALGKYQVMPSNLPAWLKEAGLPNMTPKQFLASPSAQEKVFETRSLAEYAKYGNWDDVASVWFSGAPAKNNTRGDGYNSTPQYLTKMRTGMGITSQNNGVQNNGVVYSPSVITYAKSVQENPDNMKYVPKALVPQVMAYNQANPAESNQTVTKEQQARFVIDSITKAESLADSSGISGVKKLTQYWLQGSSDYTNLASQVRSIKSNLLTIATDPAIKKFFGPQMTNNDVINMQAAASSLNEEEMSPEALREELARVKILFQKFAPGYNPTLSTVKADTIMNIHNSTTTPTTGYQIFAQ